MKARDRASGKWKSVLTQLGVPQRHLDGHHHPCPANGEGEDRFRFADRNGSGNYFCQCSQGEKGGMGLLMCCRGWSYAEAAREVERVVGGCNAEAAREKPDPRKALNRVRGLLRPVGKDVADYLAGRGLETPPGLKQAKLTHWHKGQNVGVFETMVGTLVTADNKPQSYHLTYLKDGKKAPVESPRKVMTPVDTITGASIRLYPAAAEMGVAEGIETAIAASMLFKMPVWATANANSLFEFVPPAVCTHLTVFGDRDANYTGQWAAYSLARRMVRSGLECAVLLPEHPGDWNDVLAAKLSKKAAA